MVFGAFITFVLAGCQDLPTAPPAQGSVQNELGGMQSGGAFSPPARATIQDVYRTNTADLNGDGFVTLDEVVAMKRAGLSDDQMLQRLRDTGQVYELTPAQENYLRSQGVDDFVILQMETINDNQRGRLLQSNPGGGIASPPGDAVISVPATEQPTGLTAPH